jgi:16S rRNA (guanine527-N7)-methyltransferase
LVDAQLEGWLDRLLARPGLTSIRDRDEARRVHVEDSLRGLSVVERFPGEIVDVGSGGGTPGVPLALALPERSFTLLEANGRKCVFLESLAIPNVRVVHGRAEEQEVDRFGLAVAKALAPPPVAAEWCLPLVRPGGVVVLWVGPSADPARVSGVADRLAAELGSVSDGLFVLRKLGPTPAGFPRRPGQARKRPLA